MIIQSRALENLQVEGTEYPPPPAKKMAAQIVFYIQLAIFAFIICGEGLCSAAKIPVPAFYTQLKENKMAAFMMVWLVGNMIQGSLLSTGAFEIYHGEKLIWSSLKENRLPDMGDVIRAFHEVGVEFAQSRPDGM
mmetsp:Transcript_143621/g.357975  ORF Transcript_143621/g.357975 Transcript_143621/m.357975 type:complete len:135 (+) Transcript_143621:333-737(+)